MGSYTEAPGKIKFKFTKSAIVNEVLPDGRNEMFLWDTDCKGLGVRAWRRKDTERRSWVFQFMSGGRTRRITLGCLTAVGLEDARRIARKHAGAVADQRDPVAELLKARKAAQDLRRTATVLDVIEQYLPHAEQAQRPNSYNMTRHYLRNRVGAIHKLRIDDVTHKDVADILLQVTTDCGRSSANGCRRALGAFFTWAIRNAKTANIVNPVALTGGHKLPPRDRELNDNELRVIWAAVSGTCGFNRVLRLCLLTGCRRTEIGGLRWEEINESDGWITIPAGRMKNKEAYDVPLLPAIVKLLPARPEGAHGPLFGRNGKGFTAYDAGKAHLDKRLEKAGHALERWTIHDFRRVVRSRLSAAGVAPHIAELILAHKQKGIASVYNRYSYRKERREALATWHGLLASIVGETLA
jgi:integrase